MKKSLTFIKLALLFATSYCIFVTPVIARDEHGAFAASIFHSICVIGRADPDRVSSYSEFNLAPLTPSAQQHFLAGKSGKAWSAKTMSGQFVLTIADEGKCSVHVRRVSAKEMLSKFSLLIKHMEKKGKITELPKEEKIFGFGTVTTRYFLNYPNNKEAIYLLDIATSDAPDAPAQAVISIEPKPWTF